jgi:hypothetical protein
MEQPRVAHRPADTSGLTAADSAQIALRAACSEGKFCRIAGTGRQGVSHKQYCSALRENRYILSRRECGHNNQHQH